MAIHRRSVAVAGSWREPGNGRSLTHAPGALSRLELRDREGDTGEEEESAGHQDELPVLERLANARAVSEILLGNGYNTTEKVNEFLRAGD